MAAVAEVAAAAKHWLDYAAFIIGFLVLVATFSAAIFTYQQFRIGLKQYHVAKYSAEQQLRAYIGQSPTTSISEFTAKVLTLHFSCKNFGTTPALDTKMQYGMSVSSFVPNTDYEVVNERTDGGFNATVNPTKYVGFDAVNIGNKIKELFETITGYNDKIIVVPREFNYNDEFKQPHLHNFCFFFVQIKGKKLLNSVGRRCRKHNSDPF